MDEVRNMFTMVSDDEKTIQGTVTSYRQRKMAAYG